MRIHYFAYGSNMNAAQMRRRIPASRLLSAACLEDFAVLFNKKSTDGSGKANLVACPGGVAWGALYEMDESQLVILDRLERNYARRRVWVTLAGGAAVEAVTYQSDHITDHPVALDSYKQLVLRGAREVNLPPEYLAYLEGLPSQGDAVTSRQS